jgi:hypothetical protein
MRESQGQSVTIGARRILLVLATASFLGMTSHVASARAAARWHVPAGALGPLERRTITLTNNGSIVVKVNTNLEMLTITCTQSSGTGFIDGTAAGTNGVGYITTLSVTLANCTANLACTVGEMMPVVSPIWQLSLSTNGTNYFGLVENLVIKTSLNVGGGCTQSGARELRGNAEAQYNNTTSELEFPATALGGSTLSLGVGNPTTLSGKYKIAQTLEPTRAITVGA